MIHFLPTYSITHRQTDGQMVVVTNGRTDRQRSNETEDRKRDRKREGLQRETNRGRDC